MTLPAIMIALRDIKPKNDQPNLWFRTEREPPLTGAHVVDQGREFAFPAHFFDGYQVFRNFPVAALDPFAIFGQILLVDFHLVQNWRRTTGRAKFTITKVLGLPEDQSGFVAVSLKRRQIDTWTSLIIAPVLQGYLAGESDFDIDDHRIACCDLVAPGLFRPGEESDRKSTRLN